MKRFLVAVCTLTMVSASAMFGMEVTYKGGKARGLVAQAMYTEAGLANRYDRCSASALLKALHATNDDVSFEVEDRRCRDVRELQRGRSSDRLSPKERKAIKKARKLALSPVLPRG